jgi:hypothetical protein
MTKTLDKAVCAAEELPTKLQNQVAAFLLEEVTRTELLTKIERAERDVRAGRVVSPKKRRGVCVDG